MKSRNGDSNSIYAEQASKARAEYFTE